MNFDTRTVIDVITLSDDLRKELQSMVDDELTFLLSTNDFTDDDFTDDFVNTSVSNTHFNHGEEHMNYPKICEKCNLW